jgi:amino acid adenylation domain-containing protein/non-ribosomal peptide synthase protein (TIGR01720 family)
MPRSPRLIVSLLAVLKSGPCFLAIDPGLPDARVDFLLNDSGARLVLTDGTAHIPGGAHREGVAVDQVLAAATGADPLPPPADPAGLAYVIYTSGTTGNPKGVMVEHRSLVNYVLWSIKTYVGPAPVCMPFYTSVAFDLTLTSLFTPLLSGNTLIVYDDEEAAAALEKVVTDPRINTIKLTPSHLRILRNNNLLGVNRGIRQFIVGGEQLDTQLARQVHDAFRGAVTLYNEYGPTEATVGCMIHRFNLQETQPAVPVGVPIDNLGVYLLDSYLKPVPAGVTGEMYIAGTGVARGYLHQPALTEARFLPNPFLPGTKLYKTGDLARRNAEGLIEYLGRRDQQVKIKGHRIEPGEIESELTRSGLVQAAVVLAKPGPHGDCVLWAYCQAGADVSPYALRQYLTGRIPHYMIPAHFIRLAELPVTAGGKVNYAALQALEATESPRDAGTPANALEQVFVDAWKEVLNLDAVGTTDNFFDAGGDSIKAVQMASRLLAQGVSVQARTILEYQTIEQICRQVKDNRTVRTYSQEMAAGERDPLPIERWFLRRNFPNPAHYNQSVLLQFRQRVNRKAVEEAFNRLVAAHDALRTNYNPARKTLFYNNCLTERRFLTEYFDIAHLSPECQLQELELIGTALKGSINLYNDFPLKAAVIKAGDETHYLLITAHHLTIDGVSWRILLEDFYRLYRACQHGESLKLPPKTASLKDWSQSLRALAAAPPLPDAHWEALERTPFAIPLDYEPDNWTVQHRESVSGSLSREATEFLLKQAPRTLGTGMLAPLLAALHDTLSRWMQAREVLVFVESHGRSLDDVDVSRTIGWFTSLCPLRIVDDPGPLPGLVRRIREQVDRIAGLSLSYGVSRYLNGEPGAGPAMHEVVFNYLGQFDHELNNDLFTFADHATGSDIDPANPMTAKLEFICRIIDQKLQLTVHYNALAHRRSTVQYLVSAYLTCLTDAIAQIDPGSNAVGTEPGMAEFELGEEDLKEIFG